MKLLRTIAAVAAFSMAASAASAAVTIVFQNPGADLPVGGNYTTGTCGAGYASISSIDLCSTDGNGLDYTKEWVNVNAKAFAAGDATGLVQDLRPTNSGLAALTIGETNSDDQVQLEREESILFDFIATGAPVFLVGIDFNAGADRDCANPGSEGPCGDFELFVDGISVFLGEALDDMVFASILGTTFEIVARGPELTGFSIGSITVAEVPLPGALPLILSGLAGLGFAARRRKSA